MCIRDSLYLFSEQPHVGGSFHQSPAQRAHRLVAHKQNGAFRPPEVVFQVMLCLLYTSERPSTKAADRAARRTERDFACFTIASPLPFEKWEISRENPGRTEKHGQSRLSRSPDLRFSGGCAAFSGKLPMTDFRLCADACSLTVAVPFRICTGFTILRRRHTQPAALKPRKIQFPVL